MDISLDFLKKIERFYQEFTNFAPQSHIIITNENVP